MAAKRKSRSKSTSQRSLAEYERKRDLEKTPEPAGGEQIEAERQRGKASKEPLLCVQKHLASHLHYDFRLEHRGVLLSWAVPKGPSLDPADKRLAMQTEDHPLDYGDFEGVIPAGYGAGIVMLWDTGTWMPEAGFEDVDAALKKGELKFTLNGYKLKGSWVLVRTKGGPRGSKSSKSAAGDAKRSWLLIKHRDAWAGAIDVTTLAPKSIKSGGDFADILAAGDPDVSESHRPARGGATGRLFDRIIRQAAELKVAGEEEKAEEPVGKRRSRSRKKA
jgi:bifunctional non-homologous end joining protein LigD